MLPRSKAAPLRRRARNTRANSSTTPEATPEPTQERATKKRASTRAAAPKRIKHARLEVRDTSSSGASEPEFGEDEDEDDDEQAEEDDVDRGKIIWTTADQKFVNSSHKSEVTLWWRVQSVFGEDIFPGYLLPQGVEIDTSLNSDEFSQRWSDNICQLFLEIVANPVFEENWKLVRYVLSLYLCYYINY